MKYIKIIIFIFLSQIPLSSLDKGLVVVGEVHLIESESWDFTPNNINDIIGEIPWYKGTIDAPWQVVFSEAENYHGTGTYRLLLNTKNIKNMNEISLLIPFCFGGYTIYINNSLIHSSNTTFGSKPILITLPKDLMNNDNIVLNIITNSSNGWGGFSGGMRIGSTTKLTIMYIHYIIKNVAISAITLFLSIYFLIMYMFQRKEKHTVFYSLLSFSITLFIMGYHGLWLYLFSYSWAYWLLTFLGGVGMYLFPILFFHLFLKLKFRLIGKILVGFYIFCALFILAEFLFTGKLFFFNKYLYIAFNMSYLLVVIYLIVINIKGIVKKVQYSKTLLPGTICLTLSFLYSILCFTGIITKPPLIGEGFFLMTLMFSVVLAKRAAQTHVDLELEYSKNLELNRTLEYKVETRTEELKEKNDQIMQSIDYSALIQNSILPSNENLTELFSDFYVIWRPKDIVGGDFYWCYKKGDDFLIAIIDCTGHGVPGALLTMTATSALDRIVSHINHTDPSLILTEMNKILKGLLSQDNPYDIKDDGLDIGLCHFNTNSKKLTFSGSKIRLYVDDNGELIEIKGDKQGIGYKRSKGDYTYTNHVIEVSNDKTFHMTTDGFPDQHGGEKGFGFGWTRYKELLLKNRTLTLGAQIEEIESAMFEYQGVNTQRDDITLLGFKIKV